MKKIIILSFVLVALIFLGTNLNSSARISVNNGPAQTYIQYQVTIHPNMTIIQNQCPMWVGITNGSTSEFIGQKQQYQQGVNVYHFSEIGPVYGTRVARLTNEFDGLPDDLCYAVSISDLKAGNFYSGQLYKFDLFGSAKDIIKQAVHTQYQ